MILKEKPRTQPSANIEIGVGNEVEPRRELQENVEAFNLHIYAEVTAETQHSFVVIIVKRRTVAVAVPHPDISTGAVIKIEFGIGTQRLEEQTVHVYEKEIMVIVVEIPGKQNVESHGFGVSEMQI